jgi:hypothetical protein
LRLSEGDLFGPTTNSSGTHMFWLKRRFAHGSSEPRRRAHGGMQPRRCDCTSRFGFFELVKFNLTKPAKLFALLQSRQPISDRRICNHSGSRRHCRRDVRIFVGGIRAAQRLDLHVEGSGAIAGRLRRLGHRVDGDVDAAATATADARDCACGFVTTMLPAGSLLAGFVGWQLLPIVDWRGLFLVGLVPLVLVFMIRYWVPESPRWLIGKGRIEEARRSLAWACRRDRGEEGGGSGQGAGML